MKTFPIEPLHQCRRLHHRLRDSEQFALRRFLFRITVHSDLQPNSGPESWPRLLQIYRSAAWQRSRAGVQTSFAYPDAAGTSDSSIVVTTIFCLPRLSFNIALSLEP